MGKFERVEGFGSRLLQDYDLREGELMFIISTSGINPLPIEFALDAKKIGMKVIALTAMEHTTVAQPRHSSGMKLYEISDIVIDTHVPVGDAAVQIDGLPMKVGPLSTIAAVGIMDAIVVQTTELIVQKGGTPPVRMSRNLPGGDENNRRFQQMYGDRIPEL